ncbi:hypothetical protein Tco_1403888 [Tanacetum coccineum]
MDDTRTMAQLLEAPTAGYEDAIVVPEITAGTTLSLSTDSLNSAAGGNFLDKMPRDCLRIIESKSKVRNSRNKPVVAKVSSSTSTPGISSEVAELKDMVKALLLDKKNQSPAPTPVKRLREIVSNLLLIKLLPIKLHILRFKAVSKEDFQAYVKANDVLLMRNIANSRSKMQNPFTNLTDIFPNLSLPIPPLLRWNFPSLPVTT